MPPGDLTRPSGGGSPSGPAILDRSRCQVGGVNQNYSSRAGTPYHIQIEDRGPIVDRVSDMVMTDIAANPPLPRVDRTGGFFRIKKWPRRGGAILLGSFFARCRRYMDAHSP